MSMRYKGGVLSATPPTVTISSATGLWTMQDQMRYQAAGTWPPSVTPDPYFEYVTMLLHGDGTNGAQNNTFLDSSTNNYTITRNGNTTQGSFSPFSRANGNWSNYFDGSGDNLTVASNAAFTFGTGDWTIEAWLYLSSNQATADGVFDLRPPATNGIYPAIVFNTGNTLGFYVNGVYVITSSALAVGQWYHVAVARSGTSTKMFVNGVQSGSTYTDTNNYLSSTATIGTLAGLSTGYDFTGYISNLRVVKGTAVYTGAFTPPTSPLTAITNTSLLTCQSNRFIDNSTNAFAITVNGNPSVQVFSPFNPTTVYSTTANGGSGYFDGTGDMLATPSITIGTSAFCFECWWYPTAVQGTAAGIFVANTQSGLQLSYYDTSGSGGLGIAQKGVAWQLFNNDGVKPIVNQWNHIAFVRSGTGTNQTSIFLNGTRIANGTVAYNYVASTYEVSTTQAGGTTLQGYMGGARFTLGFPPYDATQTTITIPTAPLTAITNTSLLLNFTNAGIFDNAAMFDFETVGGAQVSTVQKKFGTGSLYFDGAGDYLQMPATQNVAFGTGDFTIEFWAYSNDVSGSTQRGHLQTSTTAGGFSTGYTTGITFFQGANSSLGILNGGLAVALGTGSSYVVVGGSLVLTANQWQHIALTRSGTNARLFVDGVQVGSTVTHSYSLDATNMVLGGYYQTSYYLYQGYLDEVRITKGYARYTANFTPPTAAFPNL